jgi:tetratricopeptide (TPR) repeat protein
MLIRLRVILIILLLTPTLLASSLTPQQVQRLRGARELLTRGECDDAVILLDQLLREKPGNADLLLTLRDAHICQEEFDRAHEVVDQLINVAPNQSLQTHYMIAKAEVYLKQGAKDSADQTVAQAIQILPDDPQSYERAARTYMTNGYYNDAAQIFLQGRRRLKDNTWFASDLGRLYEITRDYGDAAEEYFRLVLADSSQIGTISIRIQNLIANHAGETFDTGLEAELARISREYPQNPHAQRFYGDYLVANGDYSQALDYYLLADSLSDDSGEDLLSFCRVAAEIGATDIVKRARDALIERHPESPAVMNSGFILGRAYFDSQRYREAVDLYHDLLQRSLDDRTRSEALFYLGYTTYLGIQKPDSALRVFDQLTAKFPRTATAQIARIYEADCHLSLGNADLADSLYKSIQLNSLPQRSQEELLFRLAEINFYLGDYDAARTAYGRLMNSFPKSVFVNDCLRRMMMITEYPDLDALTLQLYSEALYAGFRFDYDSALVIYDKLHHYGDSTLAQLAWFSTAEIKELQGLHEEALASFDSLVTHYPEGFYTPLAFEKKGDIYAWNLEDYQSTQEQYEVVLLEYPKSLNAEDVRKKLQRLKRLDPAREGESES